MQDEFKALAEIGKERVAKVRGDQVEYFDNTKEGVIKGMRMQELLCSNTILAESTNCYPGG